MSFAFVMCQAFKRIIDDDFGLLDEVDELGDAEYQQVRQQTALQLFRAALIAQACSEGVCDIDH